MGNHRQCIDSGEMSPEDRQDALADVLAEGFLYIVQNGLLEEVLTDPSPDAECDKGTEVDRAKTDASSDLSDRLEGR